MYYRLNKFQAGSASSLVVAAGVAVDQTVGLEADDPPLLKTS